MVKAMEAARQAARKALESAYDGRCDIVEYQDVTDEGTGLSQGEEAVVLEGQPCKLSFEKQAAVSQTDTAAAVTQGLKLFLAPEIKIRPGSKIIVTQNGITGAYSASGEPAVYGTHQEIALELFGRWA